MPLSDTAEAIAGAYGHLVSNFSQFWAEHHYDWVLALGDRFEMAAAVQAGIPLGVKFAHLHGGETTLGAIDNIYRHQITLAASLHFTATELFKKRVEAITGSDQGVYYVGALSLDGIDRLELPDWAAVATSFEITTGTFVLITIHPETVGYERNEQFSQVIYEALQVLSRQFVLVITLPNADTAGTLYRQQLQRLKAGKPKQVFLIENFGRLNYFSAMKAAAFLLGNTSSGIIEAASFGKYVVNIGDRQKGRLQSDNVRNVPFDKDAILEACETVAGLGDYTGTNRYFQVGTAQRIVEVLARA